MNNLASYQWLKEFVHTTASPEEFARELSLRSMSVEKVDSLAEKFAHMVVGLVNEVKAHPNANKLRIAVADVGTQIVEVVCGGSNLAEGMRVFVAMPGAKVRWHGEGDLVELKETEIRGVKSIGMICAPAEVGFEALQGGEHEIWDLSAITNAAPGTPIAEALGLDDVLFDVEITTNRPDAMGRVGLAREAAAALDAEFAWHPPALQRGAAAKPLAVTVEDQRCERYMAVVVDGVTVGPSPWWLQKRLLLAGVRPINTIVDITNYVLLEHAQPMHAFDYDELRGAAIRVRAAKGESLRALDGKEYALNGEMVIADAERPVAIAGIMGGEESGTTAKTRTVVFEAATFDPVVIRRTARAVNCYSDSQLLFEKGLSTEALPAALARAVQLAQEIAGGSVASEIVDVRRSAYHPLAFPFQPDRIRAKIGVDVSDAQMLRILTTLGFAIAGNEATVPYWRDHDIEGAVDIAEEVARMYGYHNMPSVLPTGAPPTTPEEPSLRWERWWKRALAAAGYDEFFSYSFVSLDDLRRYGDDERTAVVLLNPLASDQSHMRTSLMPSLLRAIEQNQAHTAAAHFFELSRTYTATNGIPVERMQLVFGEYGYDDAEAAFMRLRGALETLAVRCGIAVTLSRATDARWHPSRTAEVQVDGVAVGMVGEAAPAIVDAFGIDRRVMTVVLDFETLVPMLQLTHRYAPVGEFPAVCRDVSVLLDEKCTFARLAETVTATSPLITNVRLVDVYRGNGVDEGKKSVTISLTLQADRTLTSEEIDAVLAGVRDSLATQLSGILRS